MHGDIIEQRDNLGAQVLQNVKGKGKTSLCRMQTGMGSHLDRFEQRHQMV